LHQRGRERRTIRVKQGSKLVSERGAADAAGENVKPQRNRGLSNMTGDLEGRGGAWCRAFLPSQTLSSNAVLHLGFEKPTNTGGMLPSNGRPERRNIGRKSRKPMLLQLWSLPRLLLEGIEEGQSCHGRIRLKKLKPTTSRFDLSYDPKLYTLGAPDQL